MSVRNVMATVLVVLLGILWATRLGVVIIRPFSASSEEAYAQPSKKAQDGTEGSVGAPSPAPSSPEKKAASSSSSMDGRALPAAAYLEKKERELNERERALEEREKLLQALQKEIEEKLARMEEIQKNIEAFRKEQERLKNDKLDSLVKIYVNMKPKDASKLMEKLDDDLVVSIVSRMTTEQAAKIIANMEVKRAAEISQKLSQMKGTP